MSKAIPPERWKWFGTPGHFIWSRWCRFHLTTKVGPWLISTVGAFVHPRHGRGSEDEEAAWLATNWPGDDIGPNRKYETMVFVGFGECECGCGLPGIDGMEVDMREYNCAAAATKGHCELCYEYAAIAKAEGES